MLHAMDAALPELAHLERLTALARPWAQVEVACTVPCRGMGGAGLPVYVITLGNPDPGRPGVGYFGGVHGLERIGSRVVIAWLHSLVMRLPWDASLQALLEQVRLVFMPIVNPGACCAARAPTRRAST